MRRKNRRRQRGAVLAEHIIAIVPVMVTFFSLTQLSGMAASRLALKHGAIVGARAAAVYSNVANNNPGHNGSGQSETEQGVRAAIAPWMQRGLLSGVTVKVDDQSDRSDYGRYDWVTVTVTATYNCNISFPKFYGFICGAGGMKAMTETYKMPHQGAIYQ